MFYQQVGIMLCVEGDEVTGGGGVQVAGLVAGLSLGAWQCNNHLLL